MSKRPSGYREGIKATGDATFADAVAETLRSYFALWVVERHLDLTNPAMKFLRLLPLDDGEVLADCPVYAIPDLDEVGVSGSIRLIQCILEIVETKHFEKQFRRQHPAIQNDWIRKKVEIKAPGAPQGHLKITQPHRIPTPFHNQTTA